MRQITSPSLKRSRCGHDKGFMKLLFLALALVGVSGAAAADPRVYELSVPAVQCAYSSEKAMKAVEGAVPISYVRADPKAHKVTVRFEDAETSIEAIVAALDTKGYAVKRKKQLR